jgi:hypothetical protein
MVGALQLATMPPSTHTSSPAGCHRQGPAHARPRVSGEGYTMRVECEDDARALTSVRPIRRISGSHNTARTSHCVLGTPARAPAPDYAAWD